MMILNYTAQTMRLALALGLAGVGLSTAKADRRFEAKGSEFAVSYTHLTLPTILLV